MKLESKKDVIGVALALLVRGWLRWPQDVAHPVRRYWSPWWIIAWRAIWMAPTFILTVFLCCAVCLGWGRKKAENLWRDIVQ
jgi:hypothetical protein